MLGFKALVWDPDSRQVVSPVAPIVWSYGVARAKCFRDQFTYSSEEPPSERFETHPAPQLGCSCGIYATFIRMLLEEYLSNSGLFQLLVPRLFTVLVDASGKIIQFECGWRAEEARIVAVAPLLDMLYRPASWGAREAADALGVPFVLDARELLPLAAGLGYRTDDSLEPGGWEQAL